MCQRSGWQRWKATLATQPTVFPTWFCLASIWSKEVRSRISTMHAILQIEEVFVKIADALDQTTPKARSALYALARTCRTFHEPAINVLWHTQTSLIPILRCIPAQVEVQSYTKGFQRLSRVQFPKKQIVSCPQRSPPQNGFVNPKFLIFLELLAAYSPLYWRRMANVSEVCLQNQAVSVAYSRPPRSIVSDWL